LVVEIAASSASRDLNLKREAYLRAGVQEYLVVLTHVNRVQWLRREGDAFAEATPGEDGVYRSRTFPGLWLDPAALLAGDLAEVLAKVQAGVASPEHAAFVAELAARAG
jgi:Uma2 family endonuclease